MRKTSKEKLSTRRPVRVVVADVQALMLEALVGTLGRVGHLQVVAQASVYGDIVPSLERVRWDVLVLDLRWPEASGFEIVKQIKERWPARGLIIISALDVDAYGPRLLALGADSFIAKTSAVDELVAAIDSVHRGERPYVTKALAQAAVRRIYLDDDPARRKLSPRELEWLRHLVEGLPTKEAAARMTVSVSTIRTFRRRCRIKLEVFTDLLLVAYAIEHGLVPPA